MSTVSISLKKPSSLYNTYSNLYGRSKIIMNFVLLKIGPTLVGVKLKNDANTFKLTLRS